MKALDIGASTHCRLESRGARAEGCRLLGELVAEFTEGHDTGDLRPSAWLASGD